LPYLASSIQLPPYRVAAVENEAKLRLLGAGARFDVSAPSTLAAQDALSGRPGGIYQALAGDGRRVPLLKVLLSNACKNDCLYCATRCSRDLPRASFHPQELARLTVELRQAGLIEGLFLSSGIVGDADSTMARMIETVEILRQEYRFRDYVHLKLLPGASDAAIHRAAQLADRLSVNLEAPNPERLQRICPGKDFRRDLVKALLATTLRLLDELGLRRCYFSGLRPVPDTPLESREATPLAREQRLYQVEFLLRCYGFELEELVLDENGMLPLDRDPKLAAALARPELFPMEVNSAQRWELIRVPGIGPTSLERILATRSERKLTSLRQLAKLGVRSERARDFITLGGRFYPRSRPAEQLTFEL
jgi:predicted DNA-binding helix-hairpin-helix protein